MTKEEFDSAHYYKHQPCKVRRVFVGYSSNGPILDEGYIMGVDFPKRRLLVTTSQGGYGKRSDWVVADRVTLV